MLRRALARMFWNTVVLSSYTLLYYCSSLYYTPELSRRLVLYKRTASVVLANISIFWKYRDISLTIYHIEEIF